MRAATFGLSTTPVTDIKSEVRLQLERDLLALVYRSPRCSCSSARLDPEAIGRVPRQTKAASPGW